MINIFHIKKDKVKCDNCGYTIVKPYPKDQLCPKCKKFLANLFEYTPNDSNYAKLEPKSFETKTTTLSSKIKGVEAKSKEKEFTLDDEIIYLKDKEEYVKFCGVTSVERTKLFHSNNRYTYLLELTNNLDFIATGILGGTLDKMLLVRESDNNLEEKCQFYEEEGIIYIIYGIFPDKKGKWILKEMARKFSTLKLNGSLVLNKNVDELTPLEKSYIDRDFKRALKSIFNEYMDLKEVFTQDFRSLVDWIRIDYIGLSSMSIGVISLLLDKEENLNVEVAGEFDNPAEEIEMKESSITARIEAIAANTLGNTGAYPRWISIDRAVKLGGLGGLGSGGQYRFLTFKKYENNYFLSFISEGNLKKLEKAEKELEPLLYYGIDTPFSGNLKPFNRLKSTFKQKFETIPDRKIT